jgi:alpha-tubulin suppressor-like RCC1 family protein
VLLNEVISIASTHYAFAAITKDGKVIPWGKDDDGGLFNHYAEEQLQIAGTTVKFITFCIVFFPF